MNSADVTTSPRTASALLETAFCLVPKLNFVFARINIDIAFILVFVFLMFPAIPARADVFYFKDGGEVEGIVTEDGVDYLIIDMGFGTMTVRKDEIDYIEKATAGDLERLKKNKFGYEIDRGEWAPAGHDDIRMLYIRAKDDRSALKEARKKQNALQAELYRKEAELSDLLDELDKKGKELKAIDPEKMVRQYNEVVAEMNTLNAAVNKKNRGLKGLREEGDKINAQVTKLAGRYGRDFRLFKDTFNKRCGSIDRGALSWDEIYFFEELEIKIRDMEGDFTKDVALYEPEGSHIIVDAVLDDNVLAHLMVDTGASLIILSSDIAGRLGLAYEDIHAEIDLVMADGSTAKAKPVMLQSVKVGEAEARNIQAAIVDKDTVGGADGLLGMSFLRHFKVSVDSADNRLILEKVL